MFICKGTKNTVAPSDVGELVQVRSEGRNFGLPRLKRFVFDAMPFMATCCNIAENNFASSSGPQQEFVTRLGFTGRQAAGTYGYSRLNCDGLPTGVGRRHCLLYWERGVG